MDYNFKRGTIGITVVLSLMIISIVVIVNWDSISKKTKPVSASVETVEEKTEAPSFSPSETFFGGTQKSADLSAWKNDETFFCDESKLYETKERVKIEVVPHKGKKDNQETK